MRFSLEQMILGGAIAGGKTLAFSKHGIRQSKLYYAYLKGYEEGKAERRRLHESFRRKG